MLSKKAVIILLVGVLFALSVVGLYVINKKGQNDKSAIHAIPQDAALIFRINNIHNFTSQLIQDNEVWNELIELERVRSVQDNLTMIDSLSQSDAFSDWVNKNALYISGHLVGKRKMQVLYCIFKPVSMSENKVIGKLGEHFGKDLKQTARDYENNNIYTLKAGSGLAKDFYLTITKNYFLFSASPVLIEDAIRQSALNSSLLDQTEFKDIFFTSGKNKVANLYFDTRKIPASLQEIMKPGLKEEVKKYSMFGGWGEMDLNMGKSFIMLNGFISEGSEHSFLKIFSQSDPVQLSAGQILPAYISSFISFGLSDKEKTISAYATYLQSLNHYGNREKALEKIKNEYGVDIEKTFESIIGDELIYAKSQSKGGETSSDYNYTVLKCKSGNMATQTIKSIIAEIAKKKNIDRSSLISTYSPDNETSYTIYKFLPKKISSTVFGGIFQIEDISYLTLISNYLIIGNSKKALENFIYSNILGKTLNTNESYKRFKEGISNKAYILFYTNLSSSAPVFSNYFEKNLIKRWENKFDSFKRIQPFGIQVTEVSNMMYSNVLIQKVESTEDKPLTVWESLLDAPSAIKPALVINHYTKQNEIFTQDSANNIYLINKAGRVLWKQKLLERINSEIYQIDFYKNGKLQLLFSTKNSLHLIDRNGNYVERYPVRLRSPSTAGLSLFDYSNDKNYRLFIPCEDLQVYAYSKEGTIIPGWNFKGAEYPIKNSVKHFRIERKDFIVFGDKSNTYILNRRGETRVRPKSIIEKSRHNEYYINSNKSLDKLQFITSNKNGLVIGISINGECDTLLSNSYSEGHHFMLEDVNGNSKKDYIFLDKDLLHVVSENKETIIKKRFDDDIELPPVYYYFSQKDRKLGVVVTASQEIHLMNGDGTTYKGFPLDGTTQFSIGYLDAKASKFNLIVGGKNNFLYNYTVK